MTEEITYRKPDVAYLSEKDDIKSVSIQDCIDFSIQNVGNTQVHFGFLKNETPNIPLQPSDLSSFPLYRSCEAWTGEVFVKFGSTGGAVMITRTL